MPGAGLNTEDTIENKAENVVVFIKLNHSSGRKHQIYKKKNE